MVRESLYQAEFGTPRDVAGGGRTAHARSNYWWACAGAKPIVHQGDDLVALNHRLQYPKPNHTKKEIPQQPITRPVDLPRQHVPAVLLFVPPLARK